MHTHHDAPVIGRWVLAGRHTKRWAVLAGAVAFASVTLMASPAARAEDGDLDPTWGGTGVVAIPGDQGVSMVGVDGLRRVVTTGFVLQDPSGYDAVVQRFLPDGSADESYGDHGRAAPPVNVHPYLRNWSVVHHDGSVLTFGTARGTDAAGPWTLARLDDRGTLDPTFGSGGVAVVTPQLTGTPAALAGYADGRSIVVGEAVLGADPQGPGPYLGVTAVRVSADGTVDPTFGGPHGVVVPIPLLDPFARAAVTLPDGGVLIVGGGSDAFAVRLTPDGRPDPSFGTGGIAITDLGGPGVEDLFTDVALRPGEGFVVSASLNCLTCLHSDLTALAFDHSGQPDASFGVGGRVAVDFGRAELTDAIAEQPDGRIVVAGTTGQLRADGTQERSDAVVRLLPDGRLDATFAGDGTVTGVVGSTGVVDVAAQPDDRIVALGNGAITRYNPPPGTHGPAPPGPNGYWALGRDGTVHPFGEAPAYGDASVSPGGDAVDIAATPTGLGYLVLDSHGAVHAFGDAPLLGPVDASPFAPGESVASISVRPSGQGAWVFTNRGRVVPLGDAVSYGDLTALPLNGAIVDSVATPTGDGYFMVGSDGGVFAFGRARFVGSMGDTRLNQPVTALVADPDGFGYWLVARDGGVFAFSAPYRGSMGGTRLNQPVDGMIAYGNGYLMVASDGGIFVFSNRPFAGSLGDHPPSEPIVAAAAMRT
jgi:uncharacterized delta-60 repeat protein